MTNSTTPQGVRLAYNGEDIIPCPFLNISYTPIYSEAGDLIGVTNLISLNGTISDYQEQSSYEYQGTIDNISTQGFETQNLQPTEILQTEAGSDDKIINENNTFFVINGDIDPGENEWIITSDQTQKAANIGPCVSGVKKITDLLTKNGGTLSVFDTNQNEIITCVGGILRSLSFENGTNAWTHTLPYTAELEFSSVRFFNEDVSCQSRPFTSKGGSVDSSQYPLKSFSDSWSIDISESSFDFNKELQPIQNNIISLSYNISAIGQDYYNDKNQYNFKPAWEIAKNFCQKRLYSEVKKLINNILVTPLQNPCSPSASSGVLSQISGYQVFNEKIDCSFSEIGGSFSATYNSIIKANSSGLSTNNTKHNFSKTINDTTDNKQQTRKTISINGTIEGLIPGGLIYNTAGPFQLPDQGTIFKAGGSSVDKFLAAKVLKDQIIRDDDQDLKGDFKELIGIVSGNPEASGQCKPISTPIPNSLSIVENKIDGTIEYSAEYTDNLLLTDPSGTHYITNITIDWIDSVPIYAEFILPDSEAYIQDIKTVTSKEIAYTINGKNQNYIVLQDIVNVIPVGKIFNIANVDVSIPELANLPNYTHLIEKNKTQNIDLLTGNYTIQITYACTEGCNE